ncbi:hypothetical protein Taro_052721, partial [Colocasia esculenta]|nr:hypothetical protein [Colocasia esculenta]
LRRSRLRLEFTWIRLEAGHLNGLKHQRLHRYLLPGFGSFATPQRFDWKLLLQVQCQIDMEFRRPFGENTDDLVGEIARLVTLCASFDVPYWRDVPEDRKTKIYEKLVDKFELRVGDEVCNDIHIRKIIYEIAGRRYRDVRSTLYRHYQSYATDEDHLQNPPEDINANEWAWLVNYFGSQKFKVISHITGRRSFKQVSWAKRNEG